MSFENLTMRSLSYLEEKGKTSDSDIQAPIQIHNNHQKQNNTTKIPLKLRSHSDRGPT